MKEKLPSQFNLYRRLENIIYKIKIIFEHDPFFFLSIFRVLFYFTLFRNIKIILVPGCQKNSKEKLK